MITKIILPQLKHSTVIWEIKMDLKFQQFCKEKWDEYSTYTGGIGSWVHEQNFIKAMEDARKEGIQFTIDLMNKHGIAKTFNDRIKKELK